MYRYTVSYLSLAHRRQLPNNRDFSAMNWRSKTVQFQLSCKSSLILKVYCKNEKIDDFNEGLYVNKNFKQAGMVCLKQRHV